MKMLCSVKLSPHRYKTPQGYLYCKDAIIARTGPQTYLKSEIIEGSDSDEYIDVDRKPEQVFDEKTMASFEGAPLTIEHPSVSVSPDNYKDLSVGRVQNIRRGTFEGQDVMLADIIVNDAEAIALIESGEMVELSCGYDCDITGGDNPEQINIRGNHVALCEQGRAGIARIQDSRHSRKWGVKPIGDAVGKGSLIQEFGKQGKQYKIQKIVGNVIYAEELITKKNVLFKRDEENIEWAPITKSEVRDEMSHDELFDKVLEMIKSGKITDDELLMITGDEYTLGEARFDCKHNPAKIARALIEEEVITAKHFEDKKPIKDYSCVERLKELKAKKAKEGLTEEEEEEYWYCKGVVESEEAERDYLNNGDKLHRSPFEDSQWGDDDQFNIYLENISDKDAKFYAEVYGLRYAKDRSGKGYIFSHEDEDQIEEFLKDYLGRWDLIGQVMKEGFYSTKDSIKDDWIPKYAIFVRKSDGLWRLWGALEEDEIERKEKVIKQYGKENVKIVANGRLNEVEEELNEEARKVAKPHKLEASEYHKNNPRLTWGMNFHHKNGKTYPVKERTWKQMRDFLAGYGCKLVEKALLEHEFEYIPGTQAISDANGNIYAEFVDAQGVNHTLCIADYEDYINEIRPLFKDSNEKFVICLNNKNWLDSKDKPTKEIKNAKLFDSYKDAIDYSKTYCKGSIAKVKDAKLIDSKLTRDEIKVIEQLLENIEYEEPIRYDDELKVIDIFFFDKKELKKAGKKLVSLYDLELDEDPDELCITLYDKFEGPRGIMLTEDAEQKYRVRSFSYARGRDFIICEDETLANAKKEYEEYIESCKNQNMNTSFPTEYLVYLEEDKDDGKILQSCQITRKGRVIKDSADKWSGYDLLRGPASKEFKSYLRDRGLYFEPSENGRYVHFEVKNADKFVDQRAEDIRNHWAQFQDSFSKKFYVKAIKALEDQLEKLERNELLDENQEDYEKQKNKMRQTIKKQIEEYKAKIENE